MAAVSLILAVIVGATIYAGMRYRRIMKPAMIQLLVLAVFGSAAAVLLFEHTAITSEPAPWLIGGFILAETLLSIPETMLLTRRKK